MSKWQTSPLASVCTVFGDGDWIESKDQSPEGVRLVQTGNVGEGEFKDRAEKARFISQDTYTRLRCTEIFAGDCLISRLPDPLGRACLVPETGERMITAVDCTIVRFDQSKLLPEFFAYYSQAGDYLAAVEREATGTTRKRISRARLGQIPVPLAPLSEQRRIVAILDEVFEGLATAKANAEKNQKNAQDLFESYLQSVFINCGACWVSKPFEDCIEDVKYTSKIQRKEFLDEGEFPVVSQEAEFINGYWDNSMDVFKIDRPLVVFGDHTKVFKYIDFDFVLGADGVKLLQPKPFLNPKFFYYALLSEPLKSLGYARHYRLLKEVEVRYPSVHEQVAIAGRLDAIAEGVEQLRRHCEAKLVALAALKKSLLRLAFAGVL